MSALQLCYLLAVAITSVTAALPSFVPACKKDDPKLDECFLNTINTIQPQMKKGIPELKIPTMEPLELSKVNVPQFLEEFIHLELENLKIHGAGDFKLINVHVDLKDNEFSGELEIPHLEFGADYNLALEVSNLTVKGKGDIKGTATDCKGNFVLKGELKERNGEKHFHFNQLNVIIRVDKIHATLNGLIKGDVLMGDKHQHGAADMDLWLLLRPTIQDTIAEVAKDIVNGIAEVIVVDELFP
uniref:Oviposition stimulating protein n=1 Tax=Melanoplus sanguinipes TaxID=65742 RepID=A0A077DHK7_MELSA|nr:oviposition stimulating protein [Melanoplus sanguinipes]ALX00027.1 oviposition stimulating protein [Melanoplus sanguinipes]